MEKTQGFTRRNFLKGAGLGAAGLAAVGLAGCSPSQSTGSSASGTASSDTASSTAAASWRTAPEPIAEADIAETAECDALVIGLSFSGCSAFRAAAESGAKVIAMEAHPEDNHPCMGMGHFGHINSEFLKERGVDGVDPIEFLNNWQLRAANRSNVSLARKFTTTCGEAFDWYIDCLTDEERDALEIQFYPTDEAYTTFKNGLGTYIGTASTMPVQEKILANLLQVGLDAGGQLDPYQSSMGGDYYYPCDSPADPLGSAASLWINADGKRYCNEGFGFMEWAAYAGALQPAGKIANVFDSNYEALIKAQPACHMGIDYPNGGMDGLPAILEAAVAGGPEGSGPDSNPVVYAANDYETLGGYLGYEGEALDNFVASIERYNELCATGLDEDFGKEKSLMFAVNQPPYYAYAGEKTLGGMLCNTSGVAINENGQVLARETFRPIPGLFAAGNTAGSRFGIQYTTALCGVSIAFAVTQGKFTGEYVASLV